jgi:hypothetical protein
MLHHMPVIKVEPTRDYKVPYSLDDETPNTLIEEIAVAGSTAELQVEMGAPLELPNKADQEKLANLIRDAKRNPAGKGNGNTLSPALTQTNTAYATASFLRNYGQMLAFDAAQARAAITHKLMEIADCGDIKHELRALELLGKHSDIGLFTERSEITINHKTPESLENAIKERIKRLLNADIIDVTPIGMDLDEELGVYVPPGEFEEVEDAQFEELTKEADEEEELNP